ncbi:MAG TPA: oxygen-independent coproporphyrinogen III oxidase, partial [Kiloniellales bacterium]|nr:oxygen-independent coproporphyrinogen III oxidase [Kiloniellales bacterium]
MTADLLARYDLRVPRYTSYPTAPHFGPQVGPETYDGWLAGVDPALPLSLYLHVPFCDSLCWFCGCHTRVVNRYRPVAAYLELLLAEVDHVAARLPGGRTVGHIALGGGTPTILAPDDLARLFTRIGERFAIAAAAEIAVEIDPRGLDPAMPAALAAAGVRRASLGVQDLDPAVQRAVNRIQSLEETAAVARALRAAGIEALNVDLMYGLPHQSREGLLATIDAVVETLAPERLCLFGYAHVPWMKAHQRLIPESALPGPEERFAQYLGAAERLQAAGYVWIGPDHFARPEDPLALAARQGRLRRNFQGYTTDACPVRLGLGPSAIGALPQGFVQNRIALRDYRAALEAGALPVAKGVALDADDRLRAAVIERLMCDLTVDLEVLSEEFGFEPAVFDEDLAGLPPLERDGLA